MQRTFTTLLFATSILVGACGGKTPPPKSTTSTNTQTSTTTDSGSSVNVDTKEVTTEKADGTTTQEKTQKTKTESPKQ